MSILFLLAIVVGTINLDNKTCGVTIEVNNKSVHYLLSPEVQSTKAIGL